MKFVKFYLPVVWLLSLFLVSCADFKESMNYLHIGQVGVGPAKTYVYECSDEYAFTANIGDNKAWLFLPEKTITLAHAFLIPGAKFNTGDTSLWIKDDIARLEIDSVMHANCYKNPAKVVWAHAKLNRVDFRAVGNQPSWILEMVKGENIIFADYNYKINRYMFDRPEPEIDSAAAKTVFKVQNKDHALLVTIIGTPCQGSVSGELFDFMVTVRLDNNLFKGCGKSLL